MSSDDPIAIAASPTPGLLLQTTRALHSDLSKSWMVGDILDDIEAGPLRDGGIGMIDTRLPRPFDNMQRL